MKRIFRLGAHDSVTVVAGSRDGRSEQHAPIHQPERNLEIDPPFHLMQREKAPGYAVFLLEEFVVCRTFRGVTLFGGRLAAAFSTKSERLLRTA